MKSLLLIFLLTFIFAYPTPLVAQPDTPGAYRTGIYSRIVKVTTVYDLKTPPSLIIFEAQVLIWNNQPVNTSIGHCNSVLQVKLAASPAINYTQSYDFVRLSGICSMDGYLPHQVESGSIALSYFYTGLNFSEPFNTPLPNGNYSFSIDTRDLDHYQLGFNASLSGRSLNNISYQEPFPGWGQRNWTTTGSVAGFGFISLSIPLWLMSELSGKLIKSNYKVDE